MRRWLGWTLFAAMLVGLGWALYELLPPEPRWSLNEPLRVTAFSNDGRFVISHGWNLDNPSKYTGPIQVRDAASGDVVFEYLSMQDKVLTSVLAEKSDHMAFLAKRDDGHL